MKRTLLLFALLMSLLMAARFQSHDKPSQPTSLSTVSTLAFGSGNSQDHEQPLWPCIVQNKPQLWIWLGDNIQGDTDDMQLLKGKYDLEKKNPGYQQLLATCPAIGIWNEHDFGTDGSGREHAPKAESQQLMLDFLNEPMGSARRKREGAYASYTYGQKGQQVKVILLDTRYFRDELHTQNGQYVPNLVGDVLGEDQWAWLENELTHSTATIHLIGCGLQVLPEGPCYEKWASFPGARRRLLSLLQQTQPGGVILLSGGQHVAQLSQLQLPGYPAPLYELSSSGLTLISHPLEPEANPYRVSPLITQLNFGLITIHWDQQPLAADLQVRGLNNVLLFSKTVNFPTYTAVSMQAQ